MRRQGGAHLNPVYVDDSYQLHFNHDSVTTHKQEHAGGSRSATAHRRRATSLQKQAGARGLAYVRGPDGAIDAAKAICEGLSSQAQQICVNLCSEGDLLLIAGNGGDCEQVRVCSTVHTCLRGCSDLPSRFCLAQLKVQQSFVGLRR
jgi:hypothetical protein